MIRKVDDEIHILHVSSKQEAPRDAYATHARIFPCIYCLGICQPSESPRIASTYIGHVERIPESQGGLRADLSAEVAGEGSRGTNDTGRGGERGGASGEGESDNGLHCLGCIRGYLSTGNQMTAWWMLFSVAGRVSLAPCFAVVEFRSPRSLCFAYF